jgi:hypothetical protein
MSSPCLEPSGAGLCRALDSSATDAYIYMFLIDYKESMLKTKGKRIAG